MRVDWSDDFGLLYKERGQRKHGVRLLALWKIQSGLSETEVCKLVGKTHNTLRSWRRLYEEAGVEGLLQIRTGRGRKARICKETFEQDLKELQAQRPGGRIVCADIVEYIARKRHISYSQKGMYHVLHRFGFSWITSRSKHPKQDGDAIEAFKKTS